MLIEEAIKRAEDTAIGEDELCKRYDLASGYSRSHDETIRTTDAKECEKCAQEHRQLAEWLKDYKRLLESSSEIPNKSEIDCISREQALDLLCKKCPVYDCTRKCISYKAITKMSSVTPQEPKRGHWKLVQRGKRIDVCCSNCEATRIKEWAYNYTIDQLDKEDVKGCLESDDMRYCPYCGSDNREVEE